MKSNQMTEKFEAPAIAGWALTAVFAGAVGLGAWALLSAFIYGPEARAAFERGVAAEIEQENRAFCSKFGMTSGTPTGIACVRELDQVRRQHEARQARNFEVF